MAQTVTKEDIASPVTDYSSKLTTELLKRDNPATPDYLQLKLQKHHMLFVYGTLKQGGTRQSILSDCDCLGEAITATSEYIMRSIGGYYPAVVKAGTTDLSMSGKIRGEAYVIPPEKFLTLDQIEQNGRMYMRDERWIVLENQSFRTKGGMAKPFIKAWIYIAMPSWIYQQSTSVCKRIEGQKNNGPVVKYFEWENPKDQISVMRQKWNEGMYPNFARDRLPF